MISPEKQPIRKLLGGHLSKTLPVHPKSNSSSFGAAVEVTPITLPLDQQDIGCAATIEASSRLESTELGPRDEERPNQDAAEVCEPVYTSKSEIESKVDDDETTTEVIAAQGTDRQRFGVEIEETKFTNSHQLQMYDEILRMQQVVADAKAESRTKVIAAHTGSNEIADVSPLRTAAYNIEGHIETSVTDVIDTSITPQALNTVIREPEVKSAVSPAPRFDHVQNRAPILDRVPKMQTGTSSYSGPTSPLIINRMFQLWPMCADMPGSASVGKRPTYMKVKSTLIDEFGELEFIEYKDQIKAILRNAAGASHSAAELSDPRTESTLTSSVLRSTLTRLRSRNTLAAPVIVDDDFGDLRPQLDHGGNQLDNESSRAPTPKRLTRAELVANELHARASAMTVAESLVDHSPAKRCGHAAVAVLGAPGVGKSALVSQFMNSKHWPPPTNVCCIAERQYVVQPIPPFTSCNIELTLEVRDVAGDPKYRPLTNMYCNGASAVLVMYDVADRCSFEDALSLVQEMKYFEQLPILMLVGNVFNCRENNPRQIPWDEAEAYAQFYNALFCETTSITAEIVTEIFDAISIEIVARHDSALVASTANLRSLAFHERQCERAKMVADASLRNRLFTVL